MALSKIDGTNFIEGTVPSTVAPGAGKVLQVVSTTKTDGFSTTSSSLVDITGLSATITPTNISSKIMIVSFFIGANSTDSADAFQLVRDATNIGVSTGGATNQTTVIGSGATTNVYSASIMFLDNPSTTSSTTYKVQARRTSGTLYIGRNVSGNYGGIATITVYEIAG